jgi:Nuclease-related domain
MARHGATSTAGGYARARYERGLRSWRSAIRKYVILVFGPLILAGVAGGIAAGNRWSWVAGAMFGLGVGAGIVIRESPPAYIENWEIGADGERKTAQALAELGRQWTVLHDIDSGLGNYDHVLVGPAGVFVLDSKNPLGEAHIRDGAPWLRRRHDPEADRPARWLRASALDGARRLHRQLERQTKHVPWVNAVTVLWCPFPEQLSQTGRHVIVHGSQLAAWLTSLPVTLKPAELHRYATAVQALAAASETRPKAVTPSSDSIAPAA